MGEVFIIQSLEEMCDLMCGDPQEDQEEKENEDDRQ